MNADGPEVRDLMCRVERLEKQNRLLRRLGMVALVVAVSLVTMAATRPVPNVIKAREFEVVDGAGNARAMLRLVNGDPTLGLLDSAGNARAMLTLENGAPDLTLADAHGQPRAAMRLGADGSPLVHLIGENGSSTVNLGVSPDNIMWLAFGTSVNNTQLSMTVDARGQPDIELSDAEGSMDLGTLGSAESAAGETPHRSAASIVMFGKRNHVIWQAPR